MKRVFQGRCKSFTIDGRVFAASLSLNILSLLVPIAILMIFDRVIPFQSNETLKLIALALLISAGMELALKWSRTVVLNHAAETAANKNHKNFVDLSLRSTSADFSRDPATIHLERYASIGRLRDYFSGQNQALIIDLPFSVVFIAMIGLIGGWLLFVPLMTLCGILVFAGIMKRAQRTIIAKRRGLDVRRYSFLSEVLGNMATVKACAMERQMTRRFELLQEQTVDISQKLIVFSGFAQSYGAVLGQLSVVGMGITGAYFVIHDTIGMAELAACMLLNGRITQPMLKLLSVWMQSENIAAARSQLEELNNLSCCPTEQRGRPEMVGQIEFVRAAMNDSTAVADGFDDLSMVIRSGTINLISAKSRDNASALFRAILANKKLTSGFVYVDGHLPNEHQSRRGTGGIVKLEEVPAIFSGTLLENLSGFGDAAQVERAKHFAVKIGLETRINRLPMGYGTQLKTGSVFEKDPVNRQLIAIVRAMSLQPKILMMMEPTASLDTKERDALADCLQSWEDKPTLLIASPDPRMMKIADQVVTLDSKLGRTLEDFEEDQRKEQLETDHYLRAVA
jgi:ATP-binding cassette subfamily C protein LapB